MTDEQGAAADARRPHAAAMAGAFLELDLQREIAELHAESTWRTGRNAKTLVKFPDLRLVLTVLKAGAGMPTHSTDARVAVQVLSGHLRVKADGRTFDLRPGGLVTLDRGLPHDVQAVDDSAFLLTVVWPAAAPGGAAPVGA